MTFLSVLREHSGFSFPALSSRPLTGSLTPSLTSLLPFAPASLIEGHPGAVLLFQVAPGKASVPSLDKAPGHHRFL